MEQVVFVNKDGYVFGQVEPKPEQIDINCDVTVEPARFSNRSYSYIM